MFCQNFADWPNWNKEFFGPGLDLQNLNNQVLAKLTQENLDAGSSNFATTVKYTEDMQNYCQDKKNAATDMSNLVKLNLDYMSKVSNKSLEYSENVCEIFKNAIADFHTWSERNVSTAVKEAKTASKK